MSQALRQFLTCQKKQESEQQITKSVGTPLLVHYHTVAWIRFTRKWLALFGGAMIRVGQEENHHVENRRRGFIWEIF